eukprot:8532747-Pyramimonas_sp.AAC.2
MVAMIHNAAGRIRTAPPPLAAASNTRAPARTLCLRSAPTSVKCVASAARALGSRQRSQSLFARATVRTPTREHVCAVRCAPADAQQDVID